MQRHRAARTEAAPTRGPCRATNILRTALCAQTIERRADQGAVDGGLGKGAHQNTLNDTSAGRSLLNE